VYQSVPSTVDFPALEREILAFWTESRAFEKLVEKNADGPRWSFIDGPITANNPMGVHHAWGRTYKDLYQRYYAMQGYHQRYQNGFDCQGLWVEVEVEKELGFNTKREIEEYGLDKFSQKCKERVAELAKANKDLRYASKELRMFVLKRDDYRCLYCKKKLQNYQANMEHVTPWPKGRTIPANIVTACRACNKAKMLSPDLAIEVGPKGRRGIYSLPDNPRNAKSIRKVVPRYQKQP